MRCMPPGIACFGPSAGAARLEGSKAFCKEVMIAAGVPTAAHTVVSDVEAGMAAIPGYPVVIKADGLAAGKGVIIATDAGQARAALHDLLVAHRFGTERVVVEEYLDGVERSLFALCDGENAIPLSAAQDYKRIFDGDRGPNTGGMGAYSPVPASTRPPPRTSATRSTQPVLAELARARHPISRAPVRRAHDDRRRSQGARVQRPLRRPRDPGHPAPPARRSARAMHAAIRPGGLANASLDWDERAAVTVVLASRGYPQSSSSGDLITGLDAVPGDVLVTHAGTAHDAGGRIVTAGGRVLSVTALGPDTAAARAAAYAAADMIEFDGKQMRRDIAGEAA